VGACVLGKISATTHNPNARYTAQTMITVRTTTTTSSVPFPFEHAPRPRALPSRTDEETLNSATRHAPTRALGDLDKRSAATLGSRDVPDEEPLKKRARPLTRTLAPGEPSSQLTSPPAPPL